jgi:alkylation response protein AidB-like acyl-CoA dehydrogenase
MTVTANSVTDLDLLYSDVEDHLRSSVKALLADRAAPERALARAESGEPVDMKLWHTLAADLGCAGLAVPESLGGHGGTAREVAVVMEELGASVAAVPMLGSALLATQALLACDVSDQAVSELLGRLAGGAATGALAVPLPTAPGSAFPATVQVAADGTLTGRVGTVADAAVADELVVPAAGVSGPGLYAVAATDATITPLLALDLTRGVADISLSSAPARRLAGPDRAPQALDRALLFAAGLLASEQLGIAQWCLDSTVGYSKQRFQFGRPVGSFQALKHRMADMWMEIVLARTAARYAAQCLATGSDDTLVAVSLAQAYCSDAAVRAAEECIQLHGGIGMTWEHPAHLYLKRAKSDQIALGTSGRHRAALAGLVDLPAPPG